MTKVQDLSSSSPAVSDLVYSGSVRMADIVAGFIGQWANKVIDHQPGGLPFGPLLHQKPARRQRRLTGPTDNAKDSVWQKLQATIFSFVEPEYDYDAQQQSAFMTRLPYDVRAMIYELVLGGMAFHITARNTNDTHSRLLSWVCLRPDLIFDDGLDTHIACFHAAPERPTSSASDSHTSNSEWPEATGLLPLLVTCRRVYSEAINTLYRSNTFEFIQSRTAFRFLRLMIPPTRLPAIRRFKWDLQVPYHPRVSSKASRDWSDLFTFFATETTGLQHLQLKLKPLHPMQAEIIRTPDADPEGTDWIMPILRMAIDAHHARGCRVQILSNHVMLEPVVIYNDSGGSLDPSALAKACAEVHRRIRLSMERP